MRTFRITPARVLVAAWAIPFFQLVSGVFGDSQRGRISLTAAAICTLALIATLFGCFVGKGVGVGPARDLPDRVRSHQVALVALLGVGVIGAILAVRAWYGMGIDVFSGAGDTLYQMNVRYSQEDDFIGGAAGRLYASIPIFLFFCLYCLKRGVLSKRATGLLVMVALVLMISPRRSMIFTSCIAAAFLHLQGKDIRVGRAIQLLVGVVVVFVAYFGYTQFKLGKISEFSVVAVFEALSYYLNSSVFVMSELLHTAHFEDTWIFLNLPARAINYIFHSNLAVDLSVPFVYVPEPANTVPSYYYFYKSSGYIGVVVVSFLQGFVASYAMRKFAARPTFFWAVVSSMMLTTLVLSVRENVLFSYDFAWWVAIAAGMSVILTKRFRFK